jgi:hypothetical protein
VLARADQLAFGLLVSVLNEFGMNASSFDDPELTGELTDL